MADKKIILGGKLVKGDGTQPVKCDICIEKNNGGVWKIRDIAPHGNSLLDQYGIDTETVNAEGKYILPSLIDIGARMYDSAYPQRESELSSEAAAISGGYADIIALPADGNGGIYKGNALRVSYAVRADNPETIHILGKGIYTSDRYISDGGRMRELLAACKENGSVYLTMPSDPTLAGDGAIDSGRSSRMLGVACMPRSAELAAVARDIILCGETGGRVHFLGISLADSVDMIRAAKKKGISVTAGTSPLNIAMNEGDIAYYGSLAKVMPPLRDKEDSEALAGGLRDGTVDCISSLHAPLSKPEKTADITLSGFGASTLDTALPTVFTYISGGVEQRLDLIVRAGVINSGRISGIDVTLCEGGRGDFLLFDPDSEIIVSSNIIRSKSMMTPLMGLTLRGSVTPLV